MWKEELPLGFRSTKLRSLFRSTSSLPLGADRASDDDRRRAHGYLGFSWATLTCVKLAGDDRDIDLYHWSSERFSSAWINTISVLLAKGRARVSVAGAATDWPKRIRDMQYLDHESELGGRRLIVNAPADRSGCGVMTSAQVRGCLFSVYVTPGMKMHTHEKKYEYGSTCTCSCTAVPGSSAS